VATYSQYFNAAGVGVLLLFASAWAGGHPRSSLAVVPPPPDKLRSRQLSAESPVACSKEAIDNLEWLVGCRSVVAGIRQLAAESAASEAAGGGRRKRAGSSSRSLLVDDSSSTQADEGEAAAAVVYTSRPRLAFRARAGGRQSLAVSGKIAREAVSSPQPM
jgi:hypothetical protein